MTLSVKADFFMAAKGQGLQENQWAPRNRDMPQNKTHSGIFEPVEGLTKKGSQARIAYPHNIPNCKCTPRYLHPFPSS